MRALLVVNPASTGASAAVREVLACALAGQVRLEVRETKTRGHALELARSAVSERLDVVVALGGDGTVNEVVNGLLADGPRPGLPALAVVPAGSANVFARALGLPGTPVEATAALLNALQGERRRAIGLGLAGERWFTVNAGLGLDAGVVRRVDRQRARDSRAGPGLYVRCGVRQFFRSTDRRSPTLLLERPRAAPERLGLALACNTSPWTYLGSRAVVPCPQASFDTGLDLFGLRRLGTPTVLRHLHQILAASPRPCGRQVLSVHDADELVLSARTPQPFQVDGEDLGDRQRVVLRSVPAALQIVV